MFIEHEIKSKYFECMMLHSSSWRNNLVRCSESICHNLLDLAENVASEVYFKFRVIFVQVGLIFTEGKFVTCFVTTVLV